VISLCLCECGFKEAIRAHHSTPFGFGQTKYRRIAAGVYWGLVLPRPPSPHLVGGLCPALALVMPRQSWNSSDHRRGDAWGNVPQVPAKKMYGRSHIGPGFPMGINYFLAEII